MTQNDFLFRGDLAEVDPEVAELIRHETARQARFLIMIASESTVPEAVREGLSSSFHNIYAEGYPLDSTRQLNEDEILDYNTRLPEYRRLSDERYYKGTEYADIVEALARRRTAEAFATDLFPPEKLFINVQPLSGAPANSAVYTALLNVGDTVMGMDLVMGGHLTHGSPANRSGKFFNIVSYNINPETEQLDYDEMMRLALAHKPKMIIGGYSSYPIAPDWNKYREIADAVGAYLMADIAHVAGLVAAGAHPSPVGIADVVTFTTHKTLNGPRGAVIITHRRDLSNKIDKGVFPGEQGGPHMNSIAGLATAMKLAQTEQFHQLQHQTVKNAVRLAKRLTERGIRVMYGGTDTHMLSFDCSSVVGPDGTSLSGDMAANVLDRIGIVVNRQTIPGDSSALRPSGIRLGTPWITQRGFKEQDIEELADIIVDTLEACVPYQLMGSTRALERSKVDFDTLENSKLRVRALVDRMGIDTDVPADGYPHFYYIDEVAPEGWASIAISGEEASEFVYGVCTSNTDQLGIGDSQSTVLLEADGQVMASGEIERVAADVYHLHINQNAGRVLTWLRSLSDGFALSDPEDASARLAGPVDIVLIGESQPRAFDEDSAYGNKVYFVGINGAHYQPKSQKALPRFEWNEAEASGLKTPLYDLHIELGAKMAPFAGYEMPLWYDSVSSEHQAVRKHSGIFDVSHMGVFEAKGPGAKRFLDLVTTNDLSRLTIGQSHYTFFLDTDGTPLDDLMIYQLAEEHYLIVVNASNNDKDWAWLNAIKQGQVMIDADHPERSYQDEDSFTLRDLRQESAGADQRVDIALQGPASFEILSQLDPNATAELAAIKALSWASITRVKLGQYDLIVSRTGYTGERVAYELFVHPDQAVDLFSDLIKYGAVPCGLAARDSLRIEAGLPLYGHELEGPEKMNPADAGFGNYVKLYKPFFIGKKAFIKHESQRNMQVRRFQMDNKNARMAHQGDPIIDQKGRVVGVVTSCNIDVEGNKVGLGLMDLEFRLKGTQLAVYAGSAKTKTTAINELKIGKKANLAEPITLLTRFPKK